MLYITFGFIALLAIVKIFRKLTIRWNRTYTCLVGKTVIVTGANTGIGYYTALDFAMRGAKVILACRNKEAAEEARTKIIKETNNSRVFVKIIDLASLESVRSFAKDFNATEDRLDILVNNAGAGGLGNKFTEDGLQITMQVNHFGHFLLTILLLDKLKKSAPSRIVNVSSKAGKYSTMSLEDLNTYSQKFLPDGQMYAHSKLCNILFTRELAKRLGNDGVIVNALHPGSVRTELLRHMPKWMQKIVFSLSTIFLKTAEEGAQTTIYVALSKEVEGITGAIFDNCKQVGMYESAKKMEFCKEVWNKSEELVKLKPEEKKVLE